MVLFLVLPAVMLVLLVLLVVVGWSEVARVDGRASEPTASADPCSAWWRARQRDKRAGDDLGASK